MDRVSTTVRMDRATRDVLEVIAKAKGLAINALVNMAIDALVSREALAIEQDLSDTLERVRAYRSARRDESAQIQAVVDAEMSGSDPAEADEVYVVEPQGVEGSVLAILDEA
jgi:antitoxin component of RelBE/YafQ-DinJ toxin-antitoxin module